MEAFLTITLPLILIAWRLGDIVKELRK